MTLTTAQKTTLAADIRANTDPDVVAALAVRGDADIAMLYNLPSAFAVYQSSVSLKQIGESLDYSNVADLTSANNERLNVFRAYNDESADPRRVDIRAFFDDVFSGAQGTETRANLALLWQRIATIAEEIFATGAGTQGNPGALVFEGQLSANDVGEALNENP